MLVNSAQRSVPIQQVLHGYKDGHRLLESSTTLSSEARNTLLALSDMSGSSMIPGFEFYVTGYPLYESGLYALAATWYAPEMERPGCVWTHTLLIDFSHLATIPDLGILRAYFIRPQLTEDFIQYRHSIATRLEPAIADSQNYVDRGSTPNLLHALYTQTEPVLCATDNSEVPVGIILQLWSQQWPKLRRAFKFCSGALSARRLKDVDFDLQFFPRRNRSRFSRIGGVFIDDEDHYDGSQTEKWIQLAAADIQTGEWSDLRQFFFEYGPEIAESRVSFRKLARVYQVLFDTTSDDVHFDTVVRTVLEEFPKRQTANRLKQSIISGTIFAEQRSIPSYDSQAALIAVSRRPSAGAFADAAVSESRGISKRFWNERGIGAHATVKLAIAQAPKSVGTEIARGVADVISPEQLAELSRADASIVPVLVAANHQLATIPQVWRVSTQYQEEVLGAVGGLAHLSDATIAGITEAALEADSLWVAYRIAEARPEQAIFAILVWLDRQRGSRDLIAIQDVLRMHKSDVVNWLKEQPKANAQTLAVVLGAFEFDAGTIGCRLDAWRELAESSELWDADIFVRSKVALLVLAFSTGDVEGAHLAADVFGPVHTAIESSSLPWRSWEQLRPSLPDLSWYRSWDRAEMLRQGLMDRFIDYNWPRTEFLRATANERILKLMLQSDSLRRRHHAFLREIFLGVRRGETHVTREQETLLERFVQAE